MYHKFVAVELSIDFESGGGDYYNTYNFTYTHAYKIDLLQIGHVTNWSVFTIVVLEGVHFRQLGGNPRRYTEWFP